LRGDQFFGTGFVGVDVKPWLYVEREYQRGRFSRLNGDRIDGHKINFVLGRILILSGKSRR